MVRDRRFWPFLRLDPNSAGFPKFNPNQGRVTWSIELEMFEPADMLDRVAYQPGTFPDVTEEATGLDFESVLRLDVDANSGQVRTPYGGRAANGGLL